MAGPPCLFGSKAEEIAEDSCSEVCKLKTWHLGYGKFNAFYIQISIPQDLQQWLSVVV